MSTPKKLKAGPESELTKLKEVWLRMAEDSRSYWRSRFVTSGVSQAEIRKELFAKLKVNLRWDPQLNSFRDWVDRQDSLDRKAEQMQEEEVRVREEFGDQWTLDQIRDEVLRRSYANALAEGDWTSGRKTIVQDLNVKKVMLDRDKFEFNAAKLALAAVAQLKTISASKLSDVEKIDAARRALFGELPEDPKS